MAAPRPDHNSAGAGGPSGWPLIQAGRNVADFCSPARLLPLVLRSAAGCLGEPKVTIRQLHPISIFQTHDDGRAASQPAPLTFAGPRTLIPLIKNNHRQAVEQIDAARNAYFERSPDRPQSRVRTRSRQPKEAVKAKDRMRTAAWRCQNDKLGRPETALVVKQFMVSLIEVAREAGHQVEDMPETREALDGMFAAMTERGFRPSEVESRRATVDASCQRDSGQ